MMKTSLFIFSFVLLVYTEAQMTLYENDFCKSGDNRWRCKKISNCPSAQAGLKAGKRPINCGFEGNMPIVCCLEENNRPTPTSPPTAPPRPSRRPILSNKNSKSARKCAEYAKYVYREEIPPILLATSEEELKPVKFDECVRVGETLVIGGVDAMSKEFPHMAQIGYGESPRIAWLCGGSLISERFVLSAAHCSNPTNRGPAKWARLGDLNTATDEDDAQPIIVRISQRFDHPDYDSIQLYNDITLFKLERNVELGVYIRPICLDQADKDIVEAVATGWGHTEWGGRGSESLKKVSLKLVDTNRCNNSYSSSVGRQLPNGIVSRTMLCAGDREGKDTCQGDSGGPLQIALAEPYCMYSQIGITSFGKECGMNIPGVYTRVSTYVRWIESIVWP